MSEWIPADKKPPDGVEVLLLSHGGDGSYARAYIPVDSDRWEIVDAPLRKPAPPKPFTEIYVTAARKQWDFTPPSGWVETHWERFSYIECGIYAKLTADLTPEDMELVHDYGQCPDEWCAPSRRKPDPEPANRAEDPAN